MPLPVPEPFPEPEPTPHPQPTPTPDPDPGLLRRIWRWVVGGLALLAVVLVALVIIGSNTPDPQPPAPGPSGSTSTSPTGGTSPATDVVAACGAAHPAPTVERSIVIPCTTKAPVIDGDFSEWEQVPAVAVDHLVASNPGANPVQVSGSARVLWDRTALYISAMVTDPDLRDVNETRPDQYWRGDGISLEFGPDARNLGQDAGVRSNRDRHVLIGLSAGRALGAMNIATRGDFPSGGAVSTIEARVTPTDDGYRIEASIPWQVLGVLPPERGAVFAGNLNISDAKPDRTKWELGAMVSSNAERTAAVQRRPALWESFVLADPG